VGKRSGEGFVAHKAVLVKALSRVLADRLVLMDFTIGRKGFLGYIKSLGGSNIVKIVPATNGNASDTQVADKRLKVVCGSNTSYLDNEAWVKENTPMTLAELRVSPRYTVQPNMGSMELSEALTRVLPFTASDSTRPVLQCVYFVAGEGKLQLVSADGFRLAIVTLDYDDGEGKVLINRDELKGIAGALRKAKRVRLGFEKSGDTIDGITLKIATDAIQYEWRGADGQFPNYSELIPSEFNATAHIDTVEAIKAISSIKALSDNPKDYHLDLAIGDGKIVLTNPDETGETIIPADTEGEGFVRIDGGYLAEALKACGGMVDFKLTNAYSPILCSADGSADGCQVVVMPIFSERSIAQQKEDKGAKVAEAEVEPSEAELEAIEAEAEPVEEAEAKPKRRSRKSDKVAVA